MEKKWRFAGFLIAFATLFLFPASQFLYAMPDPGASPPNGKVWVKIDSDWTLVEVPPADAPYVWKSNKWEKIKEIPSGKEWVPSYWGKKGWVAAHWCPVIYPYKGATWIPGYWNTEGKWVQGTWAPKDRNPPKRQNTLKTRTWVPGHRVPGKGWRHGYWQ